MRKYVFILILFITFFTGCKDIRDDYTLSNLTDYSVTIFDESNNYYSLNPKQQLIIQHTNSACFSLVNNPYPIYIENFFNLSEIKDLKTYEIKIFNNTINTYSLIIENDPFQQNYTLLPGNSNIEIYTSKPSIKLLSNNNECDNFIFDDNKLYIF